MIYDEIRKVFLDFFESKGHKIVPSSSLIPNDPSVLFTIAGMVPFKNVFLGQETPVASRVADVQKCVRAGGKHNDLEEVGHSSRHHTFFEMLGNWSFGDYFKEEAISYSWELLTKVLKVDSKRLVVTVHKTDEESAKIWHKVAGIPDNEIIRLDKDNWWSMGDTGPCGPCTEIFYDFGENVFGGKPGTKDEDGPRYTEIWNNVFMQYNRMEDGNLVPLPKPCVDTGAGLERWACMLQGVCDNYDTDLFMALRNEIANISGIKETKDNTVSFKVISDHIRSIGFLIADGVMPSNEGRGYVVRRLIRRAMRFANLMGYDGFVLSKLYPKLVSLMGGTYPELIKEQDRVLKIIQHEETSFFSMLSNGIKLLNETISKSKNKVLDGKVVFNLYDTYGFPLDLTELILKEHNMTIDYDGYEKCMNEQKERSRNNWKGKMEQSKVLELLNTLDLKTEFVGYDSLNSESRVLKIIDVSSEVFVTEAKNTGEYVVILDKTPFYATCGGQVFDDGKINNSEIINISKINNIIAHFIKLEQGEIIKIGDIVKAKVDSRIRRKTENAHTTAHLLHRALQIVLGNDVSQKGSEVNPESVRFDFNYISAMTKEQLDKVEDIINSWVREDLVVNKKEMPIDEAKKLGAMSLFGEKYGDVVRVVSVGDFSKPVSLEFCAGTHTARTGNIGLVKIISENSIASGIRRISLLTGESALKYLRDKSDKLDNVALLIKTNDVIDKIQNMIEDSKRLNLKNEELELNLYLEKLSVQIDGNSNQVSMILNNANPKYLKRISGYIMEKSGAKQVCLVNKITDDKVILIVATDGIKDARVILKELIEYVAGNGGGGTMNFAQAGGKDSSKIKEMFDKFNKIVKDE